MLPRKDLEFGPDSGLFDQCRFDFWKHILTYRLVLSNTGV